MFLPFLHFLLRTQNTSPPCVLDLFALSREKPPPLRKASVAFVWVHLCKYAATAFRRPASRRERRSRSRSCQSLQNKGSSSSHAPLSSSSTEAAAAPIQVSFLSGQTHHISAAATMSKKLKGKVPVCYVTQLLKWKVQDDSTLGVDEWDDVDLLLDDKVLKADALVSWGTSLTAIVRKGRPDAWEKNLFEMHEDGYVTDDMWVTRKPDASMPDGYRYVVEHEH
eukprot:TRINITY_DN34827_c0_g1_i4.p1 TRINITY_DN34827_c0_g1~~TRINITY_DN34827_c0_g1_i4.p1  ORF type:complete len:223 (-),score=30.53 TRINITY_DN34827_c0_g1_i4:110-778(-)